MAFNRKRRNKTPNLCFAQNKNVFDDFEHKGRLSSSNEPIIRNQHEKVSRAIYIPMRFCNTMFFSKFYLFSISKIEKNVSFTFCEELLSVDRPHFTDSKKDSFYQWLHQCCTGLLLSFSWKKNSF
jgi:hypothetical protein